MSLRSRSWRRGDAMSRPATPEDMLHTISRLSTLLGRAQFALEHTKRLIDTMNTATDLSKYPTDEEFARAGTIITEALVEIEMHFNSPKKEASQ